MLLRKLLLCALIPLGAASAPTMAAVDLYIEIGSPPPPAYVHVVPAERPGYIRAPGYWVWREHRHVWVPAYWMRARPGYHWVPERWESRGHRHHFNPGYWERAHHYDRGDRWEDKHTYRWKDRHNRWEDGHNRREDRYDPRSYGHNDGAAPLRELSPSHRR